MALRDIKANFEVVGISEIDKDAIISYSAIHCDLDKKFEKFDYPRKADMLSALLSKNIGYNYLTKKHTLSERTPLHKLKAIYISCMLSKNLGDISFITSKNFPDCDIFTYSFPCTDISISGKRKGFAKGQYTRSGLLWEVERLLDDLLLNNRLPKVLLMENVPNIIGKKNIEDFNAWYLKLESLGYQSYYQLVNSKDHGIPQNRIRCFMISILGNYYYQFPDKRKIEIYVKDLLETDVSDNYFMPLKQYESFLDETNRNGMVRKDMFHPYRIESKTIARAITTRSGCRVTDNYLITKREHLNDDRGFIIVPEKTHKKFSLAEFGDCIYVNRPHQKRGVVQKNIVQTIKTSCDDLAVVVSSEQNLLSIRRLTPLEVWRLFGFHDEDFFKAKKWCSETQLYKQAGNAIVLNVLIDIFKQFFTEENEYEKDR